MEAKTAGGTCIWWRMVYENYNVFLKHVEAKLYWFNLSIFYLTIKAM